MDLTDVRDVDREVGMKKAKVLFVMPSLEMGGAERVVATILNHIDRDRFEPHLALLRKNDYEQILACPK